jgi:hypothetical protein
VGSLVLLYSVRRVVGNAGSSQPAGRTPTGSAEFDELLRHGVSEFTARANARSYGGRVSTLRSSLDELRAEDLRFAADEGLVADLDELERAGRVIEFERARRLAEVERRAAPPTDPSRVPGGDDRRRAGVPTTGRLAA